MVFVKVRGRWEGRVFLIESEHTVPNLLIFPSFLIDSRLLFRLYFFTPAEGILLKSLRGE